MAMEFFITGAFPVRGAGGELRRQVSDYLAAQRPAAGTRLITDAALARQSGLSRSTVKRALAPLQRAGWIERRNGQGTFAGPRASLGGLPPHRRLAAATGALRIAVLALDFGHEDHCSQGLLQGMDDAAAEFGCSIELLGSRTSELAALSQRLQNSAPDCLVSLTPSPRHVLLLGDALRLGIRAILVADQPELGLPCVFEDSVQGGAMAVGKLVAAGHRRIAFMMPEGPGRWVWHRWRGYRQGMAAAGLPRDPGLELWLGQHEREHWTERLAEFLAGARPTAVVAGIGSLVDNLGELRRAGAIRVPETLSVVAFSDPQAGAWLGLPVATVAVPFVKLGRQVAKLARAAADGHDAPAHTILPCEWRAGASLRQLRRRQ